MVSIVLKVVTKNIHLIYHNYICSNAYGHVTHMLLFTLVTLKYTATIVKFHLTKYSLCTIDE